MEERIFFCEEVQDHKYDLFQNGRADFLYVNLQLTIGPSGPLLYSFLWLINLGGFYFISGW